MRTTTRRLIAWWRSLCFLHDYGQWQQYQQKGRAYPGILGGGIPKEGAVYFEIRQHRRCKRCGKMQDTLVRD